MIDYSAPGCHELRLWLLLALRDRSRRAVEELPTRPVTRTTIPKPAAGLPVCAALAPIRNRERLRNRILGVY